MVAGKLVAVDLNFKPTEDAFRQDVRRFYAETLPPHYARRAALRMQLSKTGTFIAEEAIQLHGGIGMTWGLAMTHFAKRLMMTTTSWATRITTSRLM